MRIVHLHIAVFLLTSILGGAASAQEKPHSGIHHAIAALEQTKEELKSGERGFGGHRSKAIEHIEAALRELRQALAFADAHPGEIKPSEKP